MCNCFFVNSTDPTTAVKNVHLSEADSFAKDRAHFLELSNQAGSWEMKLAGGPLYVSSGLASILGITPGLHSPSKILKTVVPADEYSLVDNLLASVRKTGGTWEVNHYVISTNNEKVLVRHTGQVINDGQRPPAMLGAVTIIPERTAFDDDAETALRYRDLLESSPDLIVIHQDGKLVYANPMTVSMVGATSADDIIGKPILDFVHPSSRSNLMNRIVAMGQPGSIAQPDEELFLRLDGTSFWVETTSIRTIWKGKPAGQATARDITERKKAAAALQQRATHDPLTGLANRSLILSTLDKHISSGNEFAVLFVDLDRFKDINDSLGHNVGDEVLKIVANRLKTLVSSGGFTGRLAGDEFVVILDGPDSALDAAHTIADMLGETIMVQSVELSVESSVGVVVTGGVNMEVNIGAEDLLRDADAAMYKAKEAGRNRAVTFDRKMREEIQKRILLTSRLRKALELGDNAWYRPNVSSQQYGLELYYQPLVNASTREPTSVEALIRWKDPLFGMIMPDDFIPLAEDTGLIVPLGVLALNEACRQMALWRRTVPEFNDLHIAVNLSPRQFSDGNLVEEVEKALLLSGLPAEALCLEITETSFLTDTDRAKDILHQLRALGVRLSIDDFGTGYSSLAYLKDLPVDEMKIDKSFVSGLGVSSPDEAICTSVITMAHILKLEVTAEGVETKEQWEHLSRLGCDYVQGYWFSRPQPALVAQKALLDLLEKSVQ